MLESLVSLKGMLRVMGETSDCEGVAGPLILKVDDFDESRDEELDSTLDC